jgi:hypothetical protein
MVFDRFDNQRTFRLRPVAGEHGAVKDDRHRAIAFVADLQRPTPTLVFALVSDKRIVWKDPAAASGRHAAFDASESVDAKIRRFGKRADGNADDSPRRPEKNRLSSNGTHS